MARVTIKRVNEYLALEAKRRKLESEARTIATQQSNMRSDFRELIDANKGKPVRKGKHTLCLKTRKGRVPWKDEFVRVTNAATASKLQENAEPVEYVAVE